MIWILLLLTFFQFSILIGGAWQPASGLTQLGEFHNLAGSGAGDGMKHPQPRTDFSGMMYRRLATCSTYF